MSETQAKQYKRKPGYVEAIRWMGHNREELRDFGSDAMEISATVDGIASIYSRDWENAEVVGMGYWILKLSDTDIYSTDDVTFRSLYDCEEEEETST